MDKGLLGHAIMTAPLLTIFALLGADYVIQWRARRRGEDEHPPALGYLRLAVIAIGIVMIVAWLITIWCLRPI